MESIKRTQNLKFVPTNIYVPKHIKDQLENVGKIIGIKTPWKIIEHLLEINNKYLKLKHSDEYKQLVRAGKIEDDNLLFKEVKKIKLIQKMIWDKLKNDKN